MGVIIASVGNSNTLSLSHFIQCARAELLIARKPEVHSKCFNGKILFRDLTLQILNFTYKIFPISCTVMFSVVFFCENSLKINVHHMGKNFNAVRFGKIRFGIWRVTFLKKKKKKKKIFYHLKTLGWPCGFYAVDDLPRAH